MDSGSELWRYTIDKYTRWYEYIQRMDEEKLLKKFFWSEIWDKNEWETSFNSGKSVTVCKGRAWKKGSMSYEWTGILGGIFAMAIPHRGLPTGEPSVNDDK